MWCVFVFLLCTLNYIHFVFYWHSIPNPVLLWHLLHHFFPEFYIFLLCFFCVSIRCLLRTKANSSGQENLGLVRFHNIPHPNLLAFKRLDRSLLYWSSFIVRSPLYFSCLYSWCCRDVFLCHHVRWWRWCQHSLLLLQSNLTCFVSSSASPMYIWGCPGNWPLFSWTPLHIVSFTIILKDVRIKKTKSCSQDQSCCKESEIYNNGRQWFRNCDR